jgi:hypothetical protein
VLVIDGGTPRNAPAATVHNVVTRAGTPPFALLAAGRADGEKYGGEFVASNVTDISAQVVHAAAAGLTTAAAINADLVAAETREGLARRSSAIG